MGFPDTVFPEPLLKHNLLTVFYLRKSRNHIMIICVFSAHQPCTWMNRKISTLTLSDTLQNWYQNLVMILKFPGVSVESLPVVEEIVQRIIFIKNFNIQEGDYVGKLAQKVLGKFAKTVGLMSFNNHIFHTNDINSFLKCSPCPNCDIFFHTSGHFNQHLLRSKDRVRQNYPDNVYELRENLFEKLEEFNLPISEENKLFNNLAIFDFGRFVFLFGTNSKKNYNLDWKLYRNFSIFIIESGWWTHLFVQQGSTELDYWIRKPSPTVGWNFSWRWEQMFMNLTWLSLKKG